jgi:hypothetical protein
MNSILRRVKTEVWPEVWPKVRSYAWSHLDQMLRNVAADFAERGGKAR